MTEYSGATSLSVLAQDVTTALESPEVDSVVIQMDSPGGVVTGIDEMYQLLRKANKPVKAHVSGMAASACYWLACGCDEIVMSPTSKVGSIGVVQIWRGMGATSEDIEIVSSVSPRKRLTPDTEEGRKAALYEVDKMAEVFVQCVAEGRSTSPEEVSQNFGKGGMTVGTDAIDVGMADRIMTFEELLAEMAGNNPTFNGESLMNIGKLKADHPDLYEATKAEGAKEAEENFATEKSEATAKITELEAANKSLEGKLAAADTEATETADRLKALEQNEAIREAKDIKASAAQIMTEALAESSVPKALHSKVSAALNHEDFVGEEGFDAKGYAVAVKAEVGDWEKAMAVETPLAGVGFSGPEGSDLAGAADDSAVDSLLSHITVK